MDKKSTKRKKEGKNVQKSKKSFRKRIEYPRQLQRLVDAKKRCDL